MGEVADLIMDGIICQECMTVIEDGPNGLDGACGHPRYCIDCGGDPNCNGAAKKSDTNPDGSLKRRRKRRQR